MDKNDANYEEPEGIDNKSNVDIGDYPIDSFLIRNETRTVYDVFRRIKKKQYILDPDFQRDFVWDENQQSRLIESTLMRIPLPVFYLAEQEDGNIVVVDGLQRITTFYRFLNNDFPLAGLKKPNKSLNGKRFDDLSPKYQTRIEDTNLILYLIDPKVPEKARLDIFERVNSGVPLTRQQMRNCLHVGKATRWLKEQSRQMYFLDSTGSSLNPDTMRDRELINRFCGFRLLGLDQYSGDMDSFLADTLKKMNGFDDNSLISLSEEFKKSMINNLKVFRRHSFRKHKNKKQKRSVLNASLFDVLSVRMSYYDYDFVEKNAEKIRILFYGLMDDAEFIKSITSGTHGVSRVKTRFNKAEIAFQELEND